MFPHESAYSLWQEHHTSDAVSGDTGINVSLVLLPLLLTQGDFFCVSPLTVTIHLFFEKNIF